MSYPKILFEVLMKSHDHPLFLITALCLFFPIGLILLIISDHPIKRKFLMATCGGITFLALLATALIALPKTEEPGKLSIVVTRNQLTVGQSGGFAVQIGDKIVTDYSASASNGNLLIKDNVYTALKEGVTTICIQAQDQKKTYDITIVPGEATNSIVYLSPTGKRYHKTLTHAGQNAVTMTEEEALLSGKTPCKICYK